MLIGWLLTAISADREYLVIDRLLIGVVLGMLLVLLLAPVLPRMGSKLGSEWLQLQLALLKLRLGWSLGREWRWLEAGLPSARAIVLIIPLFLWAVPAGGIGGVGGTVQRWLSVGMIAGLSMSMVGILEGGLLGVDLSVVIGLIIVVAIVGGIVMGRTRGLLAAGGGIVLSAGVAAGVTGGVVALLAAKLTGGVAGAVENSVKTGRASWLARGMFGLLVMTYGFLVWLCFLGGWKLFPQ